MSNQDHARRSHRLTVLGLTWNINATGGHGRRSKSTSKPDSEKRRNAA